MYHDCCWCGGTGQSTNPGLHGKDSEEVKNWPSVIHEDDRKATIELWRRSIETGLPFNTEFRVRRADRVYRWFDARAHPLRDADGHVIRWYGLYTDIEDRKQVEQALRASELNLREEVPLHLNEVIGEVLRLLRVEAAKKRVIVETDLGQDLAPVIGDRVQLQQLMLNLLLNGIEAMDPVIDHPKRLFIRSTRESDHTVLVEIRDTGMRLKDPDTVFDAFFTTKENGMGMGLAICRSIVQAHNGRLWAASGESAGATFCFTLPLQLSSMS